MFFIRRGISPEVLRCLESLHLEYERCNKWLETENLRLIGLVYPLTGSPKNEVTPMTHEEEERAINLADAAGRARSNGLHTLADKLTAEAEKLLAPIAVIGTTFEDWCASRNYNLERFEGDYVSKMTQELHHLWVTAGGVPAK